MSEWRLCSLNRVLQRNVTTVILCEIRTRPLKSAFMWNCISALGSKCLRRRALRWASASDQPLPKYTTLSFVPLENTVVQLIVERFACWRFHVCVCVSWCRTTRSKQTLEVWRTSHGMSPTVRCPFQRPSAPRGNPLWSGIAKLALWRYQRQHHTYCAF